MPLIIQPSFAKGEIAPSLYGRTDTAAYQVALAMAYNCIIHTYGGISNRPGTVFLGPCKEHTYAPRLIPFQFKISDQYMLEFGNLYMRVIRNNAYVTATALSGANTTTAADPVVVTSNSHGLASADEIYISGMTEMVQLNGNRYNITKLTDNTFSLQNQVTDTDIDGTQTGWVAETTGGTIAQIYEITTPYVTADLDNLKYTQSADVMTLTHRTYSVRELTRTDHATWTLTEPTFAPSIADPTVVAQTVVGVDNDVNWKYKVTANKKETLEESLAGIAADLVNTASAATNANPV
ncbi:hypothetical protein LCGC14_3070000, partial [marine sediment metagenome]